MKITSLHIRPLRTPRVSWSRRRAGERRLGVERPQRLYSLLLLPTPRSRERER
jgi:hypothetical protein